MSSTSWFDHMPETEKDSDHTASIPVVKDSTETTTAHKGTVTELPVERAASHSRAVGACRAPASRSTMVLMAIFATMVIGVIAGLIFLFSGGKDDSAASERAQTATLSASPVTANEQIAVTGQCEPNDGETTLSTGDTSLRGAVAKWQKAYYAHDTSLTDYLTPDSWMRQQDWATILPEAAPEGTAWCAVMSPVKDKTVDVDLMVTFADKSSQTYKQTVHGEPGPNGSWLIADIIAR